MYLIWNAIGNVTEQNKKYNRECKRNKGNEFKYGNIKWNVTVMLN